MSLDDLNREQKRSLKQDGRPRRAGPGRRAPRLRRRASKTERTGPAQYLREVRDEMRKVAWPKWPEVRRFSIDRAHHGHHLHGLRLRPRLAVRRALRLAVRQLIDELTSTAHRNRSTKPTPTRRASAEARRRRRRPSRRPTPPTTPRPTPTTEPTVDDADDDGRRLVRPVRRRRGRGRRAEESPKTRSVDDPWTRPAVVRRAHPVGLREEGHRQPRRPHPVA